MLAESFRPKAYSRVQGSYHLNYSGRYSQSLERLMGLPYCFHPLPNIIAHRGLSQWAPENTLASFALAANNGLSWLEADIRLSKDRVPMVFHDATLQRITGNNSQFNHYTAAQLQAFDAGSWFSTLYSNEKIPTLDQLLDLAIEYNLGVNLEVKPNLNEDQLTVRVIHQVLTQRAANPPILFSSYSIDALEMCAELHPQLPRAIIIDDFKIHKADTLVGLAEGLNCTSVHIHHRLLYSPFIAKSYYASYDLLCFTVNSREMANVCWNAGCVSVFSDNGLLHQLNSTSNKPT